MGVHQTHDVLDVACSSRFVCPDHRHVLYRGWLWALGHPSSAIDPPLPLQLQVEASFALFHHWEAMLYNRCLSDT